MNLPSGSKPFAKNFEGKVAVITGGGRGIGEATTRLLAERGASVAVMSRSSSEVNALVKDLGDLYGKGKILALTGESGDVSNEKSVIAAFEAVRKKWGPADILVNCAGVIANAMIPELSLEEWGKVFAVNVQGTFLCTRELFRQQKAARTGGAVVNVSSLGGIRSTIKFAGFSAYTASKHAVVGFTEAAAVEGKEIGVRVNCVAPGAVDTVMLRSAAPSLKTKTQPIDIARVILYLCDSSASQALTGAVIEANTNE